MIAVFRLNSTRSIRGLSIAFRRTRFTAATADTSAQSSLVPHILDKFIDEIDNRFHETNIGPLVAIYQNIVVNTVLDNTLNFRKNLNYTKMKLILNNLNLS
jgi:hypothetical protein